LDIRGFSMKWLLSLSIAFFIYVPSSVFAGEWQYNLTGLVPESFYDMYFEISSSGANGDLYTIRTGAEQRENTFITIVSTHYWLKARTDSIGEAHLIIYTASNKTPTVTGLKVQPYLSPDGEHYAKIVSFLIGSFTAIAFVVASSSMNQGSSI